MALLEEKIDEIADAGLRQTIADEVTKLKKRTQFGLVFEEHQPEVVPVHSARVKRGERVVLRTGSLTEIWRVLSVHEGQAQCERDKDATNRTTFQVEQLIVVRRMGEAIYPALTPLGAVKNGDPSQPHHVLIEADNYHALQLMLFPYEEKVDCIYIDPPYNSGARDWKYNNDYVDRNDGWRHSKWLAFMERRLRIAKRLLNPEDSTLIIAIDDNELFTLGLLLEDIFKGCDRQIVNVTINPKGKARDGRLSQVDEYLIIVYLGGATAQEISVEGDDVEVRWPYLRRSDVESARGTKKGGTRQFYPIYVNKNSGKVVHIGEHLTPAQAISSVPAIKGAIPVFPIRDDGKHMNWGLTAPSLQYALDNGYVKVSRSTNENQPFNFSYLTGPAIAKVQQGTYKVNGAREDGTKIVVIPGGKSTRGTTAWKKNLHDANAYGSQIVGAVLPNKKFPFPKSIYSVFDALKLFLSNKPDALLVDFFAGSGTTLHALNLLNTCDSGKRKCVLVTNNEVSVDEAEVLRGQGHQPGDEEWDRNGICRSVTWPRSKFTILGQRDDGTPLTGEYVTGRRISREKPRSIRQLGFAEGRSLTVLQRKQITALLPDVPQSKVTDAPWLLDDEIAVSVLWDVRHAEAWIEELSDADNVTDVFIVTMENKLFASLKPEVAEVLRPVQVLDDEKRAMDVGFPANLEYFRLDFLDPNEVQMGRQFAAILPILWMMAGAVGVRPEPPPANAPWLLPNDCPFAVLTKETRFKDFLRHIEEREDLTHIFVVTNSTDTVHKLRQEWPSRVVVQLYKDYLDNFRINLSENPAT